VIIAGIAGLITLVCIIPFLPPEIKIQAILYLSISFMIFGGTVGFVAGRIQGVLYGMIIGALLPVVLQAVWIALKSLG